MLILQLLTNNELNIELVPTISTPYWYFYFKSDDLNGKEVELYLTPTFSSERFYTFIMDTTTNPIITGEGVLKVYELANNNPSPTLTGLTPNYISKYRIYKAEPTDNYHTINLDDERIN